MAKRTGSLVSRASWVRFVVLCREGSARYAMDGPNDRARIVEAINGLVFMI